MANLPRNSSVGSNVPRTGIASEVTWNEADDTWDETDPKTWETYKNKNIVFDTNSSNLGRNTSSGINLNRN